MKRLAGWDAITLYSETPNVRMHTLKVGVLELDDDRREFSIDDFRQAMQDRLHRLEPFRYQLVETPLKLHHPVWRENCDVDLNYHIRPWQLPAPGGRRELDEAVSQIASSQLDRGRPLWEVYLVQGLADNKVAIVAKVHHALADGIASANLIARGMDYDPGQPDEFDRQSADPTLTKGQLIRSALADQVRQVAQVPRTFIYTARGWRRVHRSRRKLSVRLSQPFTPPPTFINHKLAPDCRFATTTLALADIKATSKQLEVTINDAVLAVSSGALRTLLRRYDGIADHPLIASIPVSFDISADRVSGNRFTGMLVALPTHIDDPLERVRRCHENAVSAKENNTLLGPERYYRWASYLPPALAQSLLRKAASSEAQNKMMNVAISNVPGPRERGRVGGALVSEFYSIGTLTAGCGMNITWWSYVDQLNIAVLTDAATVDDPHEVTQALTDAFIELHRAAGLSDKVTVVETAMAPA